MLKYDLKISTRNAENVVLFSIIILALLSFYSFNHSSVYLLSFAWCVPVALLIAGLDACKDCRTLINNIFGNKFIVFIGDISFEFFLFHQLIINYFNKINSFIKIGNTIYAIALTLAIIVAYRIHYTEALSLRNTQ